MTDETTEIVLATVDDCLRVGNLRWRFIELQRERAAGLGMNTSYRIWLSRYDDWMNPERRHHFPPHAFSDVVRVCGSAAFCDPWLALEAKSRRQRAGDDGAQPHAEGGATLSRVRGAR